MCFRFFLICLTAFYITGINGSFASPWSDEYDKKYLGITYDRNPLFIEKNTLLRLDLGTSIRGDGIERFREVEPDSSGSGYHRSEYKYNLGHAMVSFSKPWQIKGLHGIMSLEAGGIQGRRAGKIKKHNQDGTITLIDKDYSEFNQYIGGISFGPVIGYKYLYLAAEVGAYGKTAITSRIGSKFTFGEKISIGTNIQNVKIMVFFKHFSNAGLTEKNSGQNFVGLSIGIAIK